MKKIEELLEDPVLKVKEPHTVRWLSIQNPVNAVCMCYPSVVTALAEIEKSDLVAMELHKFVVESKTALMTAYMHDVHTRLAILSRQLQKDDLVFSEVKPRIEGTLAGLKGLSKGGEKFREMKEALGEKFTLKGVELKELKKSSDLMLLITRYVKKLCESIELQSLQRLVTCFLILAVFLSR